eukprot:Rhum_TRINITY_DN13065_c0_g1::Rhum_TRINITY_DN13065_c0_g1_i1::g.56631::m.56631
MSGPTRAPAALLRPSSVLLRSSGGRCGDGTFSVVKGWGDLRTKAQVACACQRAIERGLFAGKDDVKRSLKAMVRAQGAWDAPVAVGGLRALAARGAAEPWTAGELVHLTHVLRGEEGCGARRTLVDVLYMPILGASLARILPEDGDGGGGGDCDGSGGGGGSAAATPLAVVAKRSLLLGHLFLNHLLLGVHSAELAARTTRALLRATRRRAAADAAAATGGQLLGGVHFSDAAFVHFLSGVARGGRQQRQRGEQRGSSRCADLVELAQLTYVDVAALRPVQRFAYVTALAELRVPAADAVPRTMEAFARDSSDGGCGGGDDASVLAAALTLGELGTLVWCAGRTSAGSVETKEACCALLAQAVLRRHRDAASPPLSPADAAALFHSLVVAAVSPQGLVDVLVDVCTLPPLAASADGEGAERRRSLLPSEEDGASALPAVNRVHWVVAGLCALSYPAKRRRLRAAVGPLLQRYDARGFSAAALCRVACALARSGMAAEGDAALRALLRRPRWWAELGPGVLAIAASCAVRFERRHWARLAAGVSQRAAEVREWPSPDVGIEVLKGLYCLRRHNDCLAPHLRLYPRMLEEFGAAAWLGDDAEQGGGAAAATTAVMAATAGQRKARRMFLVLFATSLKLPLTFLGGGGGGGGGRSGQQQPMAVTARGA